VKTVTIITSMCLREDHESLGRETVFFDVLVTGLIICYKVYIYVTQFVSIILRRSQFMTCDDFNGEYYVLY